MHKFAEMTKIRGGGKLTVLLAAVVTIMALPFVAGAATYYLKPGGDDSKDGTSVENAFGTVNRAFSQVHSHTAKDELIILPGEYAATTTLSMSGQLSSNIDDADVIRSSTGKPADVVIYGDGTTNVLNLARGVIVEGITFSNGVATAAGIGGGVRVGSNTAEYTSIISNCVITCCRAHCKAKAGGGAYVHGTGKILDCVIENCSATTDDGAAGVFLNNSSRMPAIERTIIRNCSGENYTDTNTVTCAGGIASGGSSGGSERIVDCVISNCTTAVKGGGAYFDFGSSALVSGTTFAQCRAIRGSGVLVAGGTGAFENCSFVENRNVAGDNGGGVLVTSTSRVSLKDCSFSGNEAGNGGALYMTVTSSASLSNCDFANNRAGDGGALYLMSGASVSMSNCTFTSNEGGFGGAVTLDQDSQSYFAFTNCVFASNTATNNGGAVSCRRGNFPNGSDPDSKTGTKKGMYGEFYSCTFTNNVAYEAGGALFHRDNSSTRDSGKPLVLRNSLFAYNSVSNPGYYHCGGGIYLLSYDKPVVDSCTIVCNNVVTNGTSTTQFGAGFYTRWKSSIVNTIIAHNTMNGESEGRNDWIRNTATVSYSCAYPAPKQGTDTNPFTAANHCISADPRFVDAANGDFRLKNSSPCKNKGIWEDWMANAFYLSGDARLLDDVSNMGCYEYIQSLGVVLIFR